MTFTIVVKRWQKIRTVNPGELAPCNAHARPPLCMVKLRGGPGKRALKNREFLRQFNCASCSLLRLAISTLPESIKMTKRYLPWALKEEIVREAYSKEKNITPTAKKWAVDNAQIRRWMKQKSEMGESIDFYRNKKILSKGRTPVNVASFEKLKDFLFDLEERNRVITVGAICRELKKIDSAEKDTDIQVLRKRIYRFLANERFTQRRATHIAQNTRYDENNIRDFVEYVNEEIRRLKINQDCVVNIDETNVDFDMTGHVTLARQGSRTVSIKSTGCSNRVTVLLGVTMSGIKLKPFLIFKGIPGGRIVREFTQLHYPEGCVYTVQKKAWIDEESFSLWIEKIWKPFCDGKISTYLIMDHCRVHLTNSVMTQLQDVGTEVDFILPGYTAKLQVLDVGINKPFKDYHKSEYEKFMIDNPGNKMPSRLDVAHMVDASWKIITKETITNTWRTIGFVNENQ